MVGDAASRRCDRGAAPRDGRARCEPPAGRVPAARSRCRRDRRVGGRSLAAPRAARRRGRPRRTCRTGRATVAADRVGGRRVGGDRRRRQPRRIGRDRGGTAPTDVRVARRGRCGRLVGRGRHRVERARRASRRRSRRRDVEACTAVRHRGRRGECRTLRTAPSPKRSTEVVLLGDPARRRSSGRGDAPTATRFGCVIGWGSAQVCDPARRRHRRRSAPTCGRSSRPHRSLRDVPVEIDLASDAGAAIAIVGDDAPAVARSLVVQLAVQCGPADWRLVVVTDDVTRHALGSVAPARRERPGYDVGVRPRRLRARSPRRSTGSTRTSRRIVVLTDVPAVLATRTSAAAAVSRRRPTGHDDRDHRSRRRGAGVLPFGAGGRHPRPRPVEPSTRTGRSARTGCTSPGWRPRSRARIARRLAGLVRSGGSRRRGVRADHRRPARGSAGRATHCRRDRRRRGDRAVTTRHRRRRSVSRSTVSSRSTSSATARTR